MAHPGGTFADRHPAAVGRILTAAHALLTTLAGTVLTVITGQRVLTVIGVLASIAFYTTGYAAAAHTYTRRGREQLAAARRDPLTGLPNRAIADQLLADTTGNPMAVALIDVDGLHMINTNLGHAAGDQYLLAIASRLQRAIPPGGVLVRQGGDEFTLLAPGVSPPQLAVDIGAALAGPTLVAGYRIQARASVGIAATHSAVDGTHARARADSAMSTAKREGGNHILVFDPVRDPEPSPDGTRPLVRRRDIDPLAGSGVGQPPHAGEDLDPIAGGGATAAELAFAALNPDQRKRLLRGVFDILEYDPDGEPCGWSSDTLQALGELFGSYGIVFTSPDHGW